MSRFLYRLRRKLCKRWAQNAFFPGVRLVLLRWAGVTIGRDVYIADGLIIVEELADPGAVTLGDRVSFGPRVTLVVSSHPNASRLRSLDFARKGPIVIDDDAWLGAGAILMPGVHVGQGAIVGAGSVVTRDVLPGHVVAGQPARTIHTINEFAGEARGHRQAEACGRADDQHADAGPGRAAHHRSAGKRKSVKPLPRTTH